LPFADPSVLVPLLHAAPWQWRGRYYAIVMFSLSNANVKAIVAYYNIKATKTHASCGLPPISNKGMSAVAAGSLALSNKILATWVAVTARQCGGPVGGSNR